MTAYRLTPTPSGGYLLQRQEGPRTWRPVGEGSLPDMLALRTNLQRQANTGRAHPPHMVGPGSTDPARSAPASASPTTSSISATDSRASNTVPGSLRIVSSPSLPRSTAAAPKQSKRFSSSASLALAFSSGLLIDPDTTTDHSADNWRALKGS